MVRLVVGHAPARRNLLQLIMPIHEHIRARDVTKDCDALGKQVSRNALRRALDRAAVARVSNHDSAIAAAFSTNAALGSPANVFLSRNNTLWIMQRSKWDKLVRDLQSAVEPTPLPPARSSARESFRRRKLTENICDDPVPCRPPSGSLKTTSIGEEDRQYTQFGVGAGGSFSPSGPTIPELGAGLYRVTEDMYGNPIFTKHRLNSDSLLRFEDERYKMVLEEINKFWGMKESYDALGLIHKRGTMLFGAPGTGKSCLLKQVMEDAVSRGNIVLTCADTRPLSRCIGPLRQVEPDRQVLAILEDVDEMGEHSLLQLFDGDNTAQNILYLGTTNYIERIAPRVLRPGRFDSKIEIGPPPANGRKAYLTSKFGSLGIEEAVVDHYVGLTDGFSFGQLREFIVSVHCYGQTGEQAAAKLANGGFIYESSATASTATLLFG